MNTRQLELFQAILRDGSLTAASASLGISQPAASKLLLHLEDSLGYALFRRQAGRLIATPEALLLAEDAAHLLRQLDALRERARQVGQRQLGLLRIGAALPVVWSLIGPALAAFRRDHPTVSVHLNSLPARELAEALRIGDIDIGLTLSPLLAPTLRVQSLAQIEIVAFLPDTHPLARRDALSPGDLADQPLISYPSQAAVGAELDAAFRDHGLQRRVDVQVASSVVALPLVASGLGVALVDGLCAPVPGVVRVPFRPRVAVTLCASTDSARPPARLLPDFLTCLRAAL